MKKMLIVIHSLRGGGSERVLVNILKHIDRNKFSITLAIYEDTFDYPLPSGINVKILDIKSGNNFFILTKNFILKILSIIKLIKTHKPDVVFSLLTSTNLTVILSALLSGCKVRLIISEHTNPSENLKNEPYGFILKKLLKWLYPKANKIIAVSNGIKENLIQHFKIPERKIAVIYNPIDIIDIQLLSQEDVNHSWFYEDIPIIISVGRLTKQKGYPYLLKSFYKVRELIPCRLLIIGDGKDKDKLINMANNSKYSKDIDFLGFQTNPFKYMARSTIFVLSSLYEGFGNVIVEAMTLGLPVIATDCPSGPSEIIEHNKNGILVPVRNETALAQAILQVLTNNSIRNKIIQGALSRAREFDSVKIVTYYEKVFNEDTSSTI